MGRVLRAGKKVGPESRGVHVKEVYVKVVGGELSRFRPVPGDPVELLPAIALARPREAFSVRSPVEIVIYDNPTSNPSQ